MALDIPIRLEHGSSKATEQLLSHFREIRNVNLIASSKRSAPPFPNQSLLSQLLTLSTILSSSSLDREAETLHDVHELSILSADFGGLGLNPTATLNPEDEKSILFLVSAYLESLNSQERAKSVPLPLTSRPEGRRGMTLSEKIFAAHDVERRGVLTPGDMVRVDVDFIMASEISWAGMEREYDALGKPGIWRNDRFWLAGDHVVDPRIKDMAKVKEFVESSERARDNFKMTEYQGMNYTIMHTEFFRSRAQPGMLIIGSDSHTCSAGSLGCLSIGLGVSDVTMPLITGETWFKVPESVNIRFVGTPPPSIGGKDTILYILQQLKRNTVASDRVVEFTGPGLEHLSCDARFAIANMTTEFGGITGIFVPDQITYDFINRRKLSRNKKNATYFRPDDDAVYAETHTIDLSKVESFVALYPSPDDVVPVGDIEGKHLDGCFIGACTTAEEDLIIGAMVLEIGLKNGIVPVKGGKRRVVPGSLPILNRLKELGFVDVYEKAGFTVGAPGCSYCVGMGADRAGEGEVWLSSQNRNFENRMGKGAIGNLASAATVAASSLEMKVTDPKPYLDAIDRVRLREILGQKSKDGSRKGPGYVEPSSHSVEHPARVPDETATTEDATSIEPLKGESTPQDVKRGKTQVLGDFIDTDALAPAEILTTCKTNEEFGQHCLKHTHPGFRSRAAQGYNIVVAGKAFGCGSSRENAVSALLGCGVQAVIAKSFGFIYGRNAPNLGLLGIVIQDESFYAAVDKIGEEGEVEVDLGEGAVRLCSVDGERNGEWPFEMSGMEKELIEIGGLTSAFRRFGKGLFDVLTTAKVGKGSEKVVKDEKTCGGVGGDLQW